MRLESLTNLNLLEIEKKCFSMAIISKMMRMISRINTRYNSFCRYQSNQESQSYKKILLALPKLSPLSTVLIFITAFTTVHIISCLFLGVYQFCRSQQLSFQHRASKMSAYLIQRCIQVSCEEQNCVSFYWP